MPLSSTPRSRPWEVTVSGGVTLRAYNLYRPGNLQSCASPPLSTFLCWPSSTSAGVHFIPDPPPIPPPYSIAFRPKAASPAPLRTSKPTTP
eukprot:579573-Prorocentrum_minimum.AAC.1